MRLAWPVWHPFGGGQAGLLWSALLLASCTSAPGGEQCRMAHVADLPVAIKDDGLFVASKLNGADVSLQVDTGSMTTLLSRKLVSLRALALSPRGYLEGVGGARGAYGFVAHSFEIGELHGHHLQLGAIDMDAADGDGLLGSDFLAQYDIDLDIGARKISLFKAQSDCTSPAAFLLGPLYSVKMRAAQNVYETGALIGVEIDGKYLTALIDSGASRTVLFRNAARRLGLRLSDLAADPHFRSHGIGEQSPVVVRHVMTPITIGDITIKNMPVGIIDQRSLGDSDMLLGMDFLTRVHVWLSFSSRTVIMEYPPQKSPPIEAS